MPEPLEWIGNPLSTAGTRCRCGSVEAELMRASPSILGDIALGIKLRRVWVLNIYDGNGMTCGGGCLSSVVLVNMMPEAAKREAEQILRWASAARDDC